MDYLMLGFVVLFSCVATAQLAQELPQDLSVSSVTSLFQVIGLSLGSILTAALAAALPAVILLLETHRFAAIGVGPDGLAIQVYVFFWRTVPWESVRAIEPPSTPRQGRYIKAMVFVERLTIWHKLISAFYGRGFGPCVLISTYNQRWQELLREVNVHIGARTLSRASRA